MSEFARRLRRERLLAIVRGRDPHASLATVLTLVEHGIALVEVSLTGADARWVLGQARARLADVPGGGQALLGAGTVLTEQDLDDVAALGVDFVVTPALADGARAAVRRGLPLLCGALTPTEVWQAHLLGADAVKVFPASLHGPAYVRALLEPFPQVALVAVGGVGADSVAEYLAAGAIAVGVGSPLLGDAAHGGPREQLQRRIAAFRAAAS